MTFSQNGNNGHQERVNPMHQNPIGGSGEPGPFLPQLPPYENEGNPDRKNGHRSDREQPRQPEKGNNGHENDNGHASDNK